MKYLHTIVIRDMNSTQVVKTTEEYEEFEQDGEYFAKFGKNIIPLQFIRFVGCSYLPENESEKFSLLWNDFLSWF